MRGRCAALLAPPPRRSRFSGRLGGVALVVAFAALLSSGASPSGAGTPRVESRQTAESGTVLEPAGGVRKPIRGGQVQSFPVPVALGQVLEILAGSKDVDLMLTLKGPDGTTLVDAYPIAAAAAAERLLWIADAAGAYSLDVRCSARPTEKGAYQLRRLEAREAGAPDRKRLAAQSAWLDLGRLLRNAGRQELSQALERCQTGLSIAAELGDPVLESRFLHGRSHVHSSLGDPRASLDDARQASLLRRGGDPHAEANSLNGLGLGHLELGQYQQALEALERALALHRSVGSHKGEAVVLSNLGDLYEALHEHRKALQFYDQTIPIARAQGDRYSEALALNNAGGVLVELGEFKTALKYYQRSLVLFQAEGNDRGEGMSLSNLGGAYVHLKQHDKARELLTRALAMRRKAGNRRGEAYTLELMGASYRDLGRHDEALSYFRQALPLASAVGEWSLQTELLMEMASIERDRGQLQQARRTIESVTAMFETARSTILSQELRLSYSQVVRKAYDIHVDVLMRLDAEAPLQGLDRAAFEVSERGRGRTLLETLQEARVDVSRETEPALLQRERDLRQQLGAKALQMSALGPRDDGQTAKLELELGELTRAYDEIRTRIQLTSPRHAALTQPAAASVQEVQAVLDDDTLLLEYHLGVDRSYLWMLTAHSLASYTLPKADEIETLARRVHDSLTQRGRIRSGASLAEQRRLLGRAEARYAQAARELSAMILGKLPAPAGKRLVIVADGALHYVPFAALPAPESWHPDDDVPLVDRLEVASLPSASLGSLLRREWDSRPPAARKVAVFADPVFDGGDGRVHARSTARPVGEVRAERASRKAPAFASSAEGLNLFRQGLTLSGASFPRLLYTRELADEVVRGLPAADVFKAVDFQASRDAVLSSSLVQYRSVFFATHGLLNTRYPELSGIVLSMVNERGEAQDGFLRLHDVYNLRLNADLVVLGACDTGLGKEIRGEGLVGLSRGFIYAGADRVLASLWEVDEEASMELLKTFYRLVQGGTRHPAALREAQLSLRRQGRWRSPYFWAGFVLQGDWR